jgi:pimeloyl-ACP methyl ester carboxylesterase
MTTYVLIHGGNVSTDTWNRIAGTDEYPIGGHLGAKCWNGTVAALMARGHQVFAPTLKDEHSSNLTEHIDQICTLITENDLRNIILVGHSYGGMVITGVAARIADKICRLVYLDAALPDPGQSLYDILQTGLSTSTASRPALPDPSAPYVEKLQYDAEKIQALPKTYILCTKNDFIDVTHVAKQKIAAAKQGWTYIELPSSHVPMADMPEKFYQLLLEAGEK